ncbi:hypothetical protein ACQ4PT_006613 [Festuca glaucescens]
MVAWLSDEAEPGQLPGHAGLKLRPWLGARRALVVGTSGYALLILANLLPTWAHILLLLPSAMRDINLPDGPVVGSFNGEFWGVFASTQVIGNLISLAVLRNRKGGGSVTGKNLLFLVFLSCTIIGIVLMCLPSKRDEKQDDSSTHSSFGAMLMGIVAPLKDRRMLLLIPLMAYSGLQQAFVWVVFTKSIVAPVLGISGVGGSMAIYGAADVVEAAFSQFKVWQSGAMAAIFFLSPSIRLQAMLILMATSLVISFGSSKGELAPSSRCAPGAVPVTMPQRAGEAVSYLFPPAPSMALHRRIGWVTTTRPRDEAWIDAGKPLLASFFSTKKKERRKAGVSGVGTGKISTLCFSLGLISTLSQQRCTCGSAGKITV